MSHGSRSEMEDYAEVASNAASIYTNTGFNTDSYDFEKVLGLRNESLRISGELYRADEKQYLMRFIGAYAGLTRTLQCKHYFPDTQYVERKTCNEKII